MLNYRVRVCVVLWEITKLLWLCHFAFPLTIHESSYGFRSCQHLVSSAPTASWLPYLDAYLDQTQDCTHGLPIPSTPNQIFSPIFYLLDDVMTNKQKPKFLLWYPPPSFSVFNPLSTFLFILFSSCLLDWSSSLQLLVPVQFKLPSFTQAVAKAL